MAANFLNQTEKARLESIPVEIDYADLVKYFTLSAKDIKKIPKQCLASNKLGFSLQVCLLRFLGFFPKSLDDTPEQVTAFICHQLKISVSKQDLAKYSANNRIRRTHQQQVMSHLGFKKSVGKTSKQLIDYLNEVAIDHDNPMVLLQLSCEYLLVNRILRPGISVLEKYVQIARSNAMANTFESLMPIIKKQKHFLDSIIIEERASKITIFRWLKQCAYSNTAASITENLEKITYLHTYNVQNWNLAKIPPNRIRFLYDLAKRSTGQALLRSTDDRRYPMIIAFLSVSLERIGDETIEMFDRYLMTTYSRSKRSLDEFRKKVAKSTNKKMFMFRKICEKILDGTILDVELRDKIFGTFTKNELLDALDETKTIARPIDDNFIDFFGNYHTSIRKFLGNFLTLISFQTNIKNNGILRAIKIIRTMMITETEKLPDNLPLDFIDNKWRSYVIKEDGKIDRKYYELCALWALRQSLRSGDIFVENSRKYADPESYLLPPDKWNEQRDVLLQQMRFYTAFKDRINEYSKTIHTLFTALNKEVANNKNKNELRIEKNKLIVPRFDAYPIDEGALRIKKLMTQYLPKIELTELIMEVDSWTNFSDYLVHASKLKNSENAEKTYLYANLIAQACNIGSSKMAQASKLSPDKIVWTNDWYFRQETLSNANNILVDYQYHLPMARYFGGGTLSSSDGQRFPVPVKARNATALPKYFGYGSGVSFYSWTSDQFSQYGTKVTPAAVRDAPYVLDAILDNATELQILEHTTDTSGYTEIVYALFDLLGLKFSPRIKDIGDQRLFKIDKRRKYDTIDKVISGTINTDLILKNTEKMLRIAGSLKSGWVTASLLIAKYQSYPRENIAVKALKEWGKINKTISILEYILNEQQQHRITAQLNKGEALHDLRRFFRFANEGAVRC